VLRQLEAALRAHPKQRPPLAFEIVDGNTLRRLPRPAIFVADWTVARLLPLLDPLTEGGHLTDVQADRARKMLEAVATGGLSGLPVSLVIDAIAGEARATGPAGHLHRRLVAAEWERGLRRVPSAPFADGDRGIYTDFWAEVAIASGDSARTKFDPAVAAAAAGAVLARAGWRAPDGAELAARALKVAHVKSVPEREKLLAGIAIELRRPPAERMIEAFVQMGLLNRDGEVLAAATPAVAALAAAWGIADRPELLRGHPELLCLPRAGDLMADVAAFGAKPARVWAALADVPGWTAADRDHAWIRFAAASTDVTALGKVGVEGCWARVLYERSGHGRWFERIWADSREVLALDRALQAVSERLRAHLPVFGSMDAFIASVDAASRERLDCLVSHPIIGDPRDTDRSFGALAQLSPWQFPTLDTSAEEAVERHVSVRGGLAPTPDPREVAAWACLAGFEPARAWLAGANTESVSFGRLPLPARLVAATQPACPDEARKRARGHALWLLAQPKVDIAELRRPIQLDREGLPLLHAALGLDRSPRSLWEAVVEVIRSTGGMPRQVGELPAPEIGDGARCALAEAVGDVDELTRIESRMESALAAGRLSTHAGEVVAFGVRMASHEQRYRAGPREPTEHPLTQLTNGLLAMDSHGHAAAVALFQLGHPEALRRRARGELVAAAASVERTWLDCWRLADLWDVSLEQLRGLLPEGDDHILLDACSDSAWEHYERDRACMDADALRRLGVDRPDLSALAVAFSRLRHCRAAAIERMLGRELRLPMSDRLAAFCDRVRGEPPSSLDLHGVVLSRVARAVAALARAGDLDVLRAWNELCREEPRSELDPTTPLSPVPAPSPGGVIRVGTDAELLRDTIRHSVAEVLTASAPLREKAWREASEPRAQRDLIEWAIEAGEPFPSWVRAAVERAAARGEGYVLWFKQPAFRRERLVCIRAHGSAEAASLASLWFDDVQKEGDDEIVAQYAELVLDWAEQSDRPIVPERWQIRGVDAGERPQGPPWRELSRFFKAALRDPRVPKERTVAVLERLWDLFVGAPSSLGDSRRDGEVPPRHLPHEITDVFDDLARLLLAAGAPGRIEALLRHGVPAASGAEPETFEAGIGVQFIDLLQELPPGARHSFSRAELLQARVLEQFQPPGFDPRWMLGQGALLNAWTGRQLALAGDDAAVDRLVGKLDEIDLVAESGWAVYQAVLSLLIRHRRDVVIEWLLREAAKSEAHAEEARGVVVAWAHAWGTRSAELAGWARVAPSVVHNQKMADAVATV
jgi:hypothetical protein